MGRLAMRRMSSVVVLGMLVGACSDNHKWFEERWSATSMPHTANPAAPLASLLTVTGDAVSLDVPAGELLRLRVEFP